MFKIENNTITVIQGDTGVITFKLADYELKTGDIVKLTVKENYKSEAVIKKQVFAFEDGVAKIVFSHTDTDIEPKTYLYDIQVNLADGRVDTVVAPSKFKVLGGITE